MLLEKMIVQFISISFISKPNSCVKFGFFFWFLGPGGVMRGGGQGWDLSWDLSWGGGEG